MFPKVLLLLIIALGFVGCSDQGGNPVHIIVPAGFEGVIQIVVAGSDSGGYSHVNNRHEYTIPADGLLYVKSNIPFEQLHRLSAADTAGNTIYWYDPPAPDADALIVRGFGSSATNQGPLSHWYAVGSSDFVDRAEHWSYGRNGPPPVSTTLPGP